jgi:hypothetical protein
MFAGHIGAAMAIGRAERRVNVGVFIFAALLLDAVLWLLVLLGWESATIPTNFSIAHQPQFVFPYSHGLLAGIAWSACAGAVVFLWHSRLKEATSRAAVLVSAAVLSHWFLDALVHVPELPLAGASSMKVGLGLWQYMPLALAIEALVVFAGLYLFVYGSGLSRAKKLSIAVLALLVLAFTVVGMSVAPPPPSVRAMAASSLAAIVIVCAFACWLGRFPHATGT